MLQTSLVDDDINIDECICTDFHLYFLLCRVYHPKAQKKVPKNAAPSLSLRHDDVQKIPRFART